MAVIRRLEHDRSPALQRFLGASPCPYAAHAEVVHVAWPDPQVTSNRLDALARELSDLACHADRDLLVLQVDGSERLENVEGAARLVRALLLGLIERDRSEQALPGAEMTDPRWDFLFGAEAWFVSLFAPFYPEGHTRWSGEPDVAFVLLQPEASFRRRGISSQHPHREALSRAVADRFEAAGIHHDPVANASRPKCLRYVKPVAPNDPPVRWWDSHPTA